MDHDEIESEPDHWDRPALQLPSGLLDPPALALTAFVTAVLSLFGAALFSGFTYLGTEVFGGRTDDDLVAAHLLGIGLTGLPLALGLLASRSSSPAQDTWVRAVARAAVLLAVTSAVLRLAVLLSALVTDGPPSGRFL